MCIRDSFTSARRFFSTSSWDARMRSSPAGVSRQWPGAVQGAGVRVVRQSPQATGQFPATETPSPVPFGVVDLLVRARWAGTACANVSWPEAFDPCLLYTSDAADDLTRV